MTTTAAAVSTHLPPGPTTPRLVQGLQAGFARRRSILRLGAAYGSAFTIDIPMFGKAVVLSEPAEVKQLFTSPYEIADNVEVNLGRILGSRSLFALEADEHRRQRKLLVPPFHGRRLRVYESLIEEETVKELASWPAGRELATLESWMRITLNAILRAVFGAEGAEFDRLRELLPRLVGLGSRLAVAPIPRGFLGRYGPWARFHRYRAEYDAIVDGLVERALADPGLDERDDVLALMLQAEYDDGTSMTRDEVADQLLTLLTAGHETTATTLAWTVERIVRHPDLLSRLVAEVDAGGDELRRATLTEVQRTRPVIDATARQVRAESMQLGRWTLARGQVVMVSILLMHQRADLFPRPETFDPDRFLGSRADMYSWIPFGGGTRRCIGAAFAEMELSVVLRTLLRDFTLETTTRPDERWHSRGVASAPARGGRVVVRRRRTAPIRP